MLDQNKGPQEVDDPLKDLESLPLPTEEEDVFEELDEVLEEVPEVVADKVRLVVKQHMYIGPMAPPEMMEAYERIYPGAAKILFDEKIEERKFRHELTRTDQRKFHNHRTQQIWLAFLVVVVSCVFAYFVAIAGHPEVAIALLSVPLAGIVSAFIQGQFKKDK